MQKPQSILPSRARISSEPQRQLLKNNVRVDVESGAKVGKFKWTGTPHIGTYEWIVSSQAARLYTLRMQQHFHRRWQPEKSIVLPLANGGEK